MFKGHFLANILLSFFFWLFVLTGKFLFHFIVYFVSLCLPGTAITLLHSEEVHHFRELIKKTGREKIPKYNIKEDKLQSMVDKYQETLARLQDAVKLESQKKSQPRGKQQITKLLQEQLMNNLEQKR